ncbi:PKD domain-containing protein [Methanocalculus chunghsingensis]|uniref:PKD domain-containing protein n=1 Tax=Methanocalculus chunghsingensis TaxID=156457 RepID=UPI001B8B515F
MKISSHLLFLLLACLCLTASAGADEAPSIQNNGVPISIIPDPEYLVAEVGDLVEYSFLVEDAPDGISGYEFIIQIDDPEIGEITSVLFPGWADLPENSTLPGQLVRCKAVDLTGAAGTGEVLLITISVRAIARGYTPLQIQVDSIDPLGPGKYDPIVSSAVLNVGDVPVPPQKPAARFSADPVAGVAPLSVRFMDQSDGNPDEFLWDFGDATGSMEQHPTKIYTIPGLYTVSLTVSNTGGSSILTKEDFIHVQETPLPPTAHFLGDPTSGAAPLLVAFTDHSTGDPDFWLWDFGDGTASEEQHPTKIYEDVGTYTVSLTTGKDIGSNRSTREGYITVTSPADPEYYLFRRSWGSFLSSPRGIAISSSGIVSVADMLNNRIMIFSSEGTFVQEITGAPGENLGGPVGVSYDEAGRLYVADTGNHQIRIFDSDMQFLRSFGERGSLQGELSFPGGIAINRSGVLAIADTGNHRIDLFNSEGGFIRHFGSQGSGDGEFRSPQGVRFDRDDTLYVSDSGNNRVVAYDRSGVQIRTYGPSLEGDGGLTAPRDVAISPYGELFIADAGNGRIIAFHQNGTYIGSFGTGRLSSPSGIAVDSRGDLYVTDATHNAVFVFSPSTPPSPPVADFAADLLVGPAPLTVTFTDRSTGYPDNWEWSFGDKTIVRDQHPITIFEIPGRYRVSLTVSNHAGNDTLTRNEYIIVNPRGDLNGNGRVDIGDVARVAYIAVGLIDQDPRAKLTDPLSDPVNHSDAAKIAYHYVGAIQLG